MEKILLLDNYDSFTYNLYAYMKQCTDQPIDVFRNDAIQLDEVDQYDTIVLSPGPGLPSKAGILIELIKKYASTKKILGVCLGMQAIGEAMGGRLQNLEKVFHGVATQVSVIEEDKLFQGLPLSFKVGRYHSWIIDEQDFPDELVVTSRDEHHQIMSVKHKMYQMHGVQFHPESILTEHGLKMIENFIKR